jgi:hypothetical protein
MRMLASQLHARHGLPAPRLQLFPWDAGAHAGAGLDAIAGVSSGWFARTGELREAPDLFVPLHLHP